MAKISIRNGQLVTGRGATAEDHLIPNDKNAKVIFFQVTTGTLQVTTGYENQTGDFIAGEIHPFATGNGTNRMTIDVGGEAGIESNGAGPRKVIMIQGTGSAYFTW